MPSSNMDDLFDTAAPGAAVPSDAPAAPQQFLTRREMRAAEAAAAAAAQAPAVEVVVADEVVAELVVTEVAVTPVDVTPVAAEPHFEDLLGLSVSVPDFSAGGIQISAPSIQVAPTRRSTNARAAAAPRKLRRAEVRHIHAGTAAPKAPRKHPVSVLATMAVVGGLFAVAGLPAYAISTPEADGVSAVAAIQSVTVNGESSVAAVRDGYEATSAEQIAAATRDDVRAANNAKYLLSGARELGDDYPWFYELGEEQGGGLSELNYYYRQCTDFVAWRINRDAGSYKAPFKWVWSNMTPTGGNASQWKYAWQQHGWPISNTPTVGDVAWFGSQNHVAYVKTVLDGGYIVVEEYNYVQSSYGQRTILASTVEAFLGAPF